MLVSHYARSLFLRAGRTAFHTPPPRALGAAPRREEHPPYVLQGHVPNSAGAGPPQALCGTRPHKGVNCGCVPPARPERGHNKTRNQRESARSTVFPNTNLTTTKNDAPLH